MKNREKKLLFLTVSVALGAVLYTSVIEPLVHTYAENAQMIELKEKQLSRSRFLNDQYPTLKKSLPSWFERVSGERLLAEDTAAILMEAEKLAAQSGINILSVKPQARRAIKGKSTAALDLDVEAGLKELCRFLYALEHEREFYRVRRLSIYGRNNDGKLRVGIQLNFNV